MIDNKELNQKLAECNLENDKLQKAYDKLIKSINDAPYDCNDIGQKILTMSCEPSTSIFYNLNRLVEINADINVYDTFIYIANESEDIPNCLSKAFKFVAAGGDNDTLMEMFNSAKDEKNFINKIDRYNGKIKRQKEKETSVSEKNNNAKDEEILALKTEIEEYLKTIEEVEAKYEKTERELYGSNFAISKVNAENINLKAQNDALAATLSEKERIIERLEQQLRDLDAIDSEVSSDEKTEVDSIFLVGNEEKEAIDETTDAINESYMDEAPDEVLIQEENVSENDETVLPEEKVSMKEIINLLNSMQDNIKAFVKSEIDSKMVPMSNIDVSSKEENVSENITTPDNTFFSMHETEQPGSIKEKIIKTIAGKITDYYSKEFDAMSDTEQATMIKDLSFDKYDEDTTLCIDYCLEDQEIDNKVIYCMVAQHANPIAFNRLAGKAN